MRTRSRRLARLVFPFGVGSPVAEPVRGASPPAHPRAGGSSTLVSFASVEDAAALAVVAPLYPTIVEMVEEFRARPADERGETVLALAAAGSEDRPVRELADALRSVLDTDLSPADAAGVVLKFVFDEVKKASAV